MKLEIDGLRTSAGTFTLAVDAVLERPVTVLCGPSGAGKTTLLEILAGLRRPAAGRIRLDGACLDDAGSGVHLAPPQRHMGYVPQDLALFPNLDVGANLHFAHRRASEQRELDHRASDHRAPHHGAAYQPSPSRSDGTAAAPAPAEVIEVLELASLLRRRVQTLSGGERQRVALGRALISAPRLLLLDEPLASLDPALRERVLDYLRRVRDRFAVPMLYVTHEAGDAAVLDGEILRLEGGRIVDRGSSEVLLEPSPGALRLRRPPAHS